MMSVDVEELKECFKDFGVNISDEALKKCQDLCSFYQLEPEGFVDSWTSYSITKLGNAVPSLSLLAEFERVELVKTLLNDSVRVIHTAKTIKESDDSEDILGSLYGTPKSKSVKRVVSPGDVDGPIKKGAGVSQTKLFSPTSFSPAVSSSTPSSKYASRKNRGDRVLCFGGELSTSRHHLTVSIKPVTQLLKSYEHMFQRLKDKAEILSEEISVISDEMEKNLELSDVTQVAQDEITILGRICCDSNGRLNASSVRLEASIDSGGSEVQLDLSHLSTYAFFPGQIVTLKGTNPTKKHFKISQTIPAPKLSPYKTTWNPDSGSLNVVIAAGPFTVCDSILYEPFTDLLTKLETDPPHLLVLLGPFVDIKNEVVSKLEPVADPDTGKPWTYLELTQSLINRASTVAKKHGIKLVVCASPRDVITDGVYPTPPLKLSCDEHCHLVSDPAFLDVNGVGVAITTTDVLMHLGKEEIHAGPGGDRLGRLAGHILEQHSFYPLHPSNEELGIDYDKYYQYARLTSLPNVLIVPSDLRYFIKDVCGCIVVNPEHLAKGSTGGYYTKIQIHSPTDIKGAIIKI